MVEGYRGLGTFHSMYNYELDEFAEWSRITYTTSSKSWRPWSMGVHEKRANLDTFLGVKYYIVTCCIRSDVCGMSSRRHCVA